MARDRWSAEYTQICHLLQCGPATEYNAVLPLRCMPCRSEGPRVYFTPKACRGPVQFVLELRARRMFEEQPRPSAEEEATHPKASRQGRAISRECSFVASGISTNVSSPKFLEIRRC